MQSIWSRQPPSKKSNHRKLSYETMEARRLLAALVVNTARDVVDPDDGLISLREAFLSANATDGADSINFNIPGSGPHTIAPTSPLPILTGGSVVVDATSQPGYTGLPLIEISGQNMTDNSPLLMLSSSGNSILGLAVNRGLGDGIVLYPNANENLIAENLIGIDVGGNTAVGNALQGIFVQSNGNRIVNNVISGNHANGVWIYGTNGSTGQNNVLSGNKIGTNKSGNMAVPNVGNGVRVAEGARGNLVGGNLDGTGQVIVTGPGNVISGNGYAGVWIEGESTTGNLLLNNLIGINAAGTNPLGNANTGVVIISGANNVVGLNRPDGLPSNIISGNATDGLSIVGGNSTKTRVENNYFGTDANGTYDIGNGSNGIYLDTSENRFVSNLISGNDYVGVYLNGLGGVGGRANVFNSNRIGTNKAGTSSIGNRYEGILLVNGAQGNFLGGEADSDGKPIVTAPGNLISGNGGHGIGLVFTTTKNNFIINNKVGTNLDGLSAIPNARWGVSIVDAPNNWVGLARPDGLPSNVISGNAEGGITIIASGATGNIVENNYVGTDVSGLNPLRNGSHGIYSGSATGWDTGTYSASGNAAGTFIQHNVISGNGFYGVWIAKGFNNSLTGNVIGLGSDKSKPLGNLSLGVVLDGPNNTVGGPLEVDRNIISGNFDSGVWSLSHGNLIQGNTIGSDFTGTLDRGNRYQGIVLSGHSDRVDSNLISGNDTSGVWISHDRGAGYNNSLTNNLIGTDESGILDLGNALHGVILTAGTYSNWIGATLDGTISGNVIAGNDWAGIDIESSNDNVILGNTIGLGSDGITALVHPAVGIYVVGSRNRIGSGKLEQRL